LIFHIALRNVFRNKSRLLLSTLIVAIASLLLVFATGQIAGVDKTLRTSMINTLIGHSQVKPKAVPVDFFEASLGRLRHYIQADGIHQLLVKVRAVEGVEAVAPRLRFGALVGDEKGSTGTMIMAVDPIAEKRVSPDLSSMLDVIEQNSQAAFISEELSERTNLGISDEILVLAETPEEIPNVRPYDISGFSTAPILIDEYMKGIFLIDLSSARRLMYGNNMGDDSGITSEIAIRVKAEYVDQLPKVIERIEATLSKEEKEFLGVYSYRELAKAVGNVSNIAKSMMAPQIGAVMFVMLVIVLIITKMGLHERRGEIGTLMSIGMARGH
jgi:putative ABC transport system permease protein